MKQIFTIFCLFILLKQAAAGDTIPAPPTTVAHTVMLSPNPTFGKTNLELTGFSGKVLIQISNGDEIMQRYVVKTSLSSTARQYIDLNDYKAGIYRVTITDEQGNHTTEELMLYK